MSGCRLSSAALPTADSAILDVVHAEGGRVRSTDRVFARLVGGVLAAARSGSTDMADAHAVAAAVETGGGVVVTGDASDIGRLAAPFPNVHIAAI
jgi:hypothetical protein